MRDESQDRRLHDYLDGRLPEEQRAEMETRLREDPELARRLAELGEIGELLREAPAALSPGFYTRTRQRFEESVRGERRFGIRLWSWEGLGLVGAAILAGVIFLPPLMRQADPTSLPAALEQEALAPELESSAADAILEESVQDPAEAPADRRGRVPADAFADAPAEDPVARRSLAKPEERDADLRVRPETAPAPQELQSKLREQEPVRARKAQAGKRAELEPGSGRMVKARADELPAPAAPPPPEPEPAAKQRLAAELEGLGYVGDRETPGPAAARTDELELERGYAATALSDEYSPERRPIRVEVGTVAELPPGVVSAGRVRIVDRQEEWELLLRGPASAAMAQLGGYDEDKRWILVGPRARAFACSQLRVHAAPRGYELFLQPPAPGVRATPGGCVLVLPRDGLPVSVVDAARGDAQ